MLYHDYMYLVQTENGKWENKDDKECPAGMLIFQPWGDKKKGIFTDLGTNSGWVSGDLFSLFISWCFTKVPLEALSDPDILWWPCVGPVNRPASAPQADTQNMLSVATQHFLLKQDPPPHTSQTAGSGLVWLRSEGPMVPRFLPLCPWCPQSLFDPSSWGYWQCAASWSFLSD